MVEALIISNVMLWLIVIALAAVVLALTRQIGILHERVAPAGALAAERGPRVGEAAPVLEVEDWHGTRRAVGGAEAEGRSTLLFFLSPTCPVCKTLLPTLRSVMRAEGQWLGLVLASDGERSEHEAFVREQGLEAETYVLSAELGLAYQVAKLPYAVLVDGAGVVRAKGIVNTREHLESLFEAKERGVGSIQEYVDRVRDGRRVA
jgi:methylamine dehydrogenase accessory protein MauD